jgi:hypothetical protein
MTDPPFHINKKRAQKVQKIKGIARPDGILLNMKTGSSMLIILQIEEPVPMEQGLCKKSPLAPL